MYSSTSRSQSQPLAIAMPAHAGEMLFLEGDPCEYVYELRATASRAVSAYLLTASGR
jgi:hypothetical protein